MALKRGEAVIYLYGDHLGSTSLTRDSSSGTLARQWYSPYGTVRLTEETLPTDYTFTGQKQDSNGLLFYQARYYDAYLNRWVQPDSIVPDPFNPQQLNRYSYTLNNPLRYTDPSGHCPFCVVGAVGGALGGAIYGYGSQVSNNLNQGMGWNALTSNIDPGQIVFYTAAGTVIGGTLGVGLAVADAAITSAAAAKAATTAATITAAASADGDPTNEVAAAGQVVQQVAPKIYPTTNTAASVLDKLNRYLLNPEHPEGGPKAEWFRQALGFTRDNMDDLANQIKFDPSKAVPTQLTEFGQKYEQSIAIVGANGKTIDVPFIWIENLDDVVRLVTVPWIPEP